MLFSHPDVYAVVAEVAGQIVGSNFLWEGPPLLGWDRPPLSRMPVLADV